MARRSKGGTGRSEEGTSTQGRHGMAGQTPGEDRRREGGKSNTGGEWHVERGRHGSKQDRNVVAMARRSEEGTSTQGRHHVERGRHGSKRGRHVVAMARRSDGLKRGRHVEAGEARRRRGGTSKLGRLVMYLFVRIFYYTYQLNNQP